MGERVLRVRGRWMRNVSLRMSVAVAGVALFASYGWAQPDFFSQPDKPATNDTTPAEPEPPVEKLLRDPIRFRFAKPDTRLTAEEIQRRQQLAETLRVIEVYHTPRRLTGILAAGEPAEKIRVEKLIGDKYAICVGVNYLRYGIDQYTLVRKPISQEDWDSLIEVIAEYNLLEWTPANAGREVPIQSDISGIYMTGGTASNRQVWFGPLDNGNGPNKLSNEMLRLARRSIPYLPLAYIQPKPIVIEEDPADEETPATAAPAATPAVSTPRDSTSQP